MEVQLHSTFTQEDNSMCLWNAGTHLPDCTWPKHYNYH